MTEREPIAELPEMPEGYVLEPDSVKLLPWSWAVARLEAARNYWFSTTRPNGRPHAMPAWAAWIDGILYFEGSPETRRAKNVAKNPAISVHLESGDEVVIIEGEAHAAGKPDPALGKRLAEIFATKYGASHGYRPEPTQWDEGGLWTVRPLKAFGWSEFPKDLTRWRF